ncbi:MAG TPA: response regulator [Verrucomicrobiae bacterium]|jgi:CheY-like chemotaxis protein
MPHPQHILLAEDEDNDVFFIKRAFQKALVTNPIHRVRDGEEAQCYLAGKGPFSDREKFPLPLMLLLDLKMPKISGLEVISWIRQQPGLKGLVVAVLTFAKETSEVEKAMAAGANGALVKPVDLHGLLEMMSQVRLCWEIKPCGSLIPENDSLEL